MLLLEACHQAWQFDYAASANRFSFTYGVPSLDEESVVLRCRKTTTVSILLPAVGNAYRMSFDCLRDHILRDNAFRVGHQKCFSLSISTRGVTSSAMSMLCSNLMPSNTSSNSVLRCSTFGVEPFCGAFVLSRMALIM